MSKRYCNNNWIKAIEDLEWFIKEVGYEQECIKQGMCAEPLSGFNGFWYGLVKDFELDQGDELALQALIATQGKDFNSNINNPYLYDNADMLIIVLKNTIDFLITQKINCQISADTN